MRVTLLAFLILNIPLWSYCQKTLIEYNKDSLLVSKSGLKEQSGKKIEKSKSKFSIKINKSQSNLKIYKKKYCNSYTVFKNNIKSKKKKLLSSDTSLKSKSVLKKKKKKGREFSDSLKNIKDSLISKSKDRKEHYVSRIKYIFSKRNLDSNQIKIKGLFAYYKTKSTNIFSFKKKKLLKKDSNIRSQSRSIFNKKKAQFKLSSDSTKSLKDSLISKSNAFKNKSITNLKGQFSKVDLLSLQGSVLLESYNSTMDVPFSALNSNYQRITLDATVKLLGLPIKTEGYFTTDKSGYYPSNMFKVYFDSESFKEDGMNKINQIKESEEDKLKSKFNETKQKHEAELKNTLAFQNYYTNRKSYFENNLNSQIKGLNLPENDSLTNLINKPNYSIDYKLHKFDSLKQVRPDLNLADTSDFRRYISTKMEIDRLDSCNKGLDNKYKEIKDKWGEDSLKFVSQLENSKHKLSEAKSFGRNLSPSQFLGSIKSFQIGIINPRFSDLSVSGISVKGFGAKIGGKTWSFETFKGKTYTVKNTIKQGQVYDLPVFGFQYKNKVKKNEFYVHSTSFEENVPNNFQKTKTLLFGGGSNFTFLKNNLNGIVEANISHSTKYMNIPVQRISANENNKNDLYNGTFAILRNIAFKGSLNYINENWGSFKVIYKNIQPGFDNSLVPFLRKDFSETQLNWQKKYFKSKLTLKVSYKYLTDNLQNIKPNTNKIKGFGFEAKGQFKNGLALSVLYQPYDLSNNNPDTIFRTQNKFSILQSTIMYIINSKKILHVFSLMGMMNKSNYSGLLSQTYTINGTANLSFNNKYLLEMNASTNIIPKNEDSLNHHSFGLNAGIKTKILKRIEINIYNQTSMILYKYDGYLIQSGLTFNTKLKYGTTLGITGFIGLNNIITYKNDPNFYTLKISVKHPLNYGLKKSNFKQIIKPKTKK